MITINEETLRSAADPHTVVSALEDAFRAPQGVIPRSRYEVSGGDLLIMPAIGTDGFGVKLISVAKDATKDHPLIQGSYILFSGRTLSPIASFEAAALTAVRTAGVSAFATKHLARKNARRLLIFGAGVEAREHLRFMLSVRPIEHVRIVSRTESRASELAAHARSLGVTAEVGTVSDVSQADIVCTCTTAVVPLFPGKLLSAGTHINAIGTHRPAEREIDTEAVLRGKVIVESRDAALREAGELCIPLASGSIDQSHIAADLSEVLERQIRQSDSDITIFKSVGLAFEDLAVASAVYKKLHDEVVA